MKKTIRDAYQARGYILDIVWKAVTYYNEKGHFIMMIYIAHDKRDKPFIIGFNKDGHVDAFTWSQIIRKHLPKPSWRNK